MGFTLFHPDKLEWQDRDRGRHIATLTPSLTQSRANIWRYPPGGRGRRHIEHAQEEVFVVLEGALTIAVGDPPEPVEVPRGGVVVVEIGTPLQVRNESEAELVLLSWGAPARSGEAEILPDPD